MNTNKYEGLEFFIMKNCGVFATKIDSNWLQFLEKEKGFEDVNIGDYYYIDAEGKERVLENKYFENIFRKLTLGEHLNV